MRRTVEAPDIPGSPINNKEISDDTMFEEPISGLLLNIHLKRVLSS